MSPAFPNRERLNKIADSYVIDEAFSYGGNCFIALYFKTV